MHIAMISTPFIPVPPPRYGGTELIVAELVAGLRARGHRVTLFTVGGGEAPLGRDARALHRRPVWPPDPYHELQHAAWAIGEVIAGGGADVIHSHCGTSLALARFVDAPIVYSLHHHRVEALASYYALQRGVRFVAISGRQRALHPELEGEGRVEVVHHGLDPARYPFGRGGGPAAFLGRLSPEKGPHVAIDVARRAGVGIRLAGEPHAADADYFEREVFPRLRWPGVEHVGEVDHARKVPLLGGARALLFPIDWEEPFGLVMIEAMLCGTPVLAFARGSVPEVIDDGITGWVCADADEMAARLRTIDRLDRRRCRARAVERFSRERMVADYLAAYARAIAEFSAVPDPPFAVSGDVLAAGSTEGERGSRDRRVEEHGAPIEPG